MEQHAQTSPNAKHQVKKRFAIKASLLPTVLRLCIDIRIGFLLVVVLLFLVGCQTASISSPLWGDLKAGNYNVGLQMLTFADTTRTDSLHNQRTEERAIEVFLWYPALPQQNQAPMQFREYLHFLPQFKENLDPESLADWLSIGITGKSNAVGRDTLNHILNAPMQARHRAPVSPGRFPLVLWTMRHETMIAQSVLCEYLASHGYVVAAARYAGEALPGPWALSTELEKQSAFATHLNDLRFALSSLEQEPYIDTSRVAVLTWSYAAELAPRMQMNHANIQLVIGLSSNPLSPMGVYQGNEAARYLDAERLSVPYVILSERIGFNGQERTPPAILEQLPSTSYYVQFNALAHGNFNTLEGMIPGVFDISTVQPWSKGGAVAQLGYETISRYVLFFLNDQIQSKARSHQLDMDWEKRLPTGFATVTKHPRPH